jgi:DNA invertase Pin-like site-specific DNA recombinase
MEPIKVKSIVAYYLINAKKQRDPSRELETQRGVVTNLARDEGATIEAEYTEIDSGRPAERTELTKAVAHAQLINGTLVVAKLGRLSKRSALILQLLEKAAVDFLCCDHHYIDRFTIHTLAVAADSESQAASVRTKQALATAKKNGVLLGSARPDHWKGREHKRGWKKAVQQASIVRTQKAKKHYERILPQIRQWKENGGLTLEQIAARLNQENYSTTTGSKFTVTTVWRILNRYSEEI